MENGAFRLPGCRFQVRCRLTETATYDASRNG